MKIIGLPFWWPDFFFVSLSLQREQQDEENVPEICLYVQECLEELILKELEMGKASGRTGAFDVSVLDTEQRLTVIIKDVGKAYNPRLTHHDADINYQYQNGLNCLYINFEKIKE